LIAPLLDRVYLDITTRRVGAITPAPAFRTLIDRALEASGRSACVVLTTNETDRPDDWSAWWRRGSPELPREHRVPGAPRWSRGVLPVSLFA
jgi:hypothetical protein